MHLSNLIGQDKMKAYFVALVFSTIYVVASYSNPILIPELQPRLSYDGSADDIQLCSENVHLTLKQDTVWVEGTYLLRNINENMDLSIGISYPGDYYDINGDLSVPHIISDLSVKINGTAVSIVQSFYSYNSIIPIYRGKIHVANWYSWNVFMARNEIVELQIEYACSGFNKPAFQMPEGLTLYFLSTGSTWAGLIDSAKVVLSVNRDVIQHISGFYPLPTRVLSDSVMEWQFNSFEPTTKKIFAFYGKGLLAIFLPSGVANFLSPRAGALTSRGFFMN